MKRILVLLVGIFCLGCAERGPEVRNVYDLGVCIAQHEDSIVFADAFHERIPVAKTAKYIKCDRWMSPDKKLYEGY